MLLLQEFLFPARAEIAQSLYLVLRSLSSSDFRVLSRSRSVRCPQSFLLLLSSCMCAGMYILE